LGDKFVVGVASYKRNVPVILLVERMRMLKALECVDDVVSYDKLEYVTQCKMVHEVA